VPDSSELVPDVDDYRFSTIEEASIPAGWTIPAEALPVSIPAEAASSAGPLGLSWKVWGVGAVVLAVGGYIIMSDGKKSPTPNRRRRRAR
jgi:hypothetical protein